MIDLNGGGSVDGGQGKRNWPALTRRPGWRGCNKISGQEDFDTLENTAHLLCCNLPFIAIYALFLQFKLGAKMVSRKVFVILKV